MQKGIKNQNIFKFSYSSRFQLSLDIYIAGYIPKSKKSRMDWFWVDPFLLGYGWIHHYILVIIWPYIKNRIFGENRDFFEFWQFLINRNSADRPAGGGRNHNSYSETYSLGILKAFSYSDHHCMVSRLNLMVLWKSLEFPL